MFRARIGRLRRAISPQTPGRVRCFAPLSARAARCYSLRCRKVGILNPSGTTSRSRILVVDDEPQTARIIERMAEHFGHEVMVASSVESAIQRFSEAPFDVVLTDLNLGRQNGFDLLRHVLDKAPEVPVVVITGYASIDSAMEAIRAGAYDYLPKPPTLEVMGTVLSRAVEKKRQTEAIEPEQDARITEGLENIAGRSQRMLEVYKTVARVAPGRSSVMIQGESGTGRSWWRARSTGSARARSAASSRSTSRRSRKGCWRASCSGTSREPSPGRPRRAAACSRRPIAARSSSTRSAISHRRSSRSCCA